MDKFLEELIIFFQEEKLKNKLKRTSEEIEDLKNPITITDIEPMF